MSLQIYWQHLHRVTTLESGAVPVVTRSGKHVSNVWQCSDNNFKLQEPPLPAPSANADTPFLHMYVFGHLTQSWCIFLSQKRPCMKRNFFAQAHKQFVSSWTSTEIIFSEYCHLQFEHHQTSLTCLQCECGQWAAVSPSRRLPCHWLPMYFPTRRMLQYN